MSAACRRPDQLLASIIEHLQLGGFVALQPVPDHAHSKGPVTTVGLMSGPRRLARLPQFVAEAAARQGARLIQVIERPDGAVSCIVSLSVSGDAPRFVALESSLGGVTQRGVIDRFARPPGLNVAVFGPDGIGKTSLLDGLSELLRPAFSAVHRAHFRPSLGRRTATREAVIDPHAQHPRSWAASAAKLAAYTFDHVAGYTVDTHARLRRGELVLYDRHLADLRVDPLRYRYGASTALVGIAQRLIPQPDLTLVLDAPTAVVQARCQEVAPAETRRQLAAYRDLASRSPRAHVVDASGDQITVLHRAANVIIEHLAARAQKRLS